MLFCSFVKPTQNKVYLILSYTLDMLEILNTGQILSVLCFRGRGCFIIDHVHNMYGFYCLIPHSGTRYGLCAHCFFVNQNLLKRVLSQ